MTDLILDESLIADLKSMRAELTKLFSDLRIADFPQQEHRIGGKERLERVPAFQKKHFSKAVDIL